jgi:hypothetical protein
MFAFSTNGNSTLVSVGVVGFNMAINANYDNPMGGFIAGSASHCYLTRCASTDNHCGFVSNGSYSMEGCAASYCNYRGIWTEGGNIDFVKGYTFIAGCFHGIVVASNGQMGVIASVPSGQAICGSNDYYGLWCYNGGAFAFSSTINQLWLANNTLSQATHYDVVVQNFGIVSGSQCIVGSRIFNSPVGTINSTGGLIN